MNIFIGNLAFEAKEEDVKKLFDAFGDVEKVKLRKKSGQNSRGFGFVNMPDEAEANAAIKCLDGKDFMGRPIRVSEEVMKVKKPKVIKRVEEEIIPVIPEKKEKRKFIKVSGAKVWQKRKGTGTSKAWKKKPGGVKKKFKYKA